MLLWEFSKVIIGEAVPKLQFWKTSSACPDSLNLIEKLGRTLVRFDRFFQELVPSQTKFAHHAL
jgi:hypothetical protein